MERDTCPTCGLGPHSDCPPGALRCRTARLYAYAELMYLSRSIPSASERGTRYASQLTEPRVTLAESLFVTLFVEIVYCGHKNARLPVPEVYKDVPRYFSYDAALAAIICQRNVHAETVK